MEKPSMDDSDAAALGSLVVERKHGENSAQCTWSVKCPNDQLRAIWSKFFHVGEYRCRLFMHRTRAPRDSLALYIQFVSPVSNSVHGFTAYALSISNSDDLNSSNKTLRQAWHRICPTKKSYGWCDFATASSFGESFTVRTDVLILDESFEFLPLRAAILKKYNSADQFGRLTWKIHNFSNTLDAMKGMNDISIRSSTFQIADNDFQIIVYPGVYGSSGSLRVDLEQVAVNDPDRTFWISCKMMMANQIEPERSVSKEYTFSPDTLNNPVIQLVKVDENDEFLVNDTMVFVCEILDGELEDFSERTLKL